MWRLRSCLYQEVQARTGSLPTDPSCDRSSAPQLKRSQSYSKITIVFILYREVSQSRTYVKPHLVYKINN